MQAITRFFVVIVALSVYVTAAPIPVTSTTSTLATMASSMTVPAGSGLPATGSLSQTTDVPSAVPSVFRAAAAPERHLPLEHVPVVQRINTDTEARKRILGDLATFHAGLVEGRVPSAHAFARFRLEVDAAATRYTTACTRLGRPAPGADALALAMRTLGRDIGARAAHAAERDLAQVRAQALWLLDDHIELERLLRAQALAPPVTVSFSGAPGTATLAPAAFKEQRLSAAISASASASVNASARVSTSSAHISTASARAITTLSTKHTSAPTTPTSSQKAPASSSTTVRTSPSPSVRVSAHGTVRTSSPTAAVRGSSSAAGRALSSTTARPRASASVTASVYASVSAAVPTLPAIPKAKLALDA